MLSKLKLEGYRGFDAYELADLSRVNLLVGPNNCGKTSILEAVHFLVSEGDPSVLTRTARRRGEVSDTGAEPTRRARPDVSHWFFGRRFEPGRRFRLSAEGGHGPVAVTVRPAEPDEARLFESDAPDEDDTNQLPLLLQIEGASTRRPVVLPVAGNGVLLDSRPLKFRSSWSAGASPSPSVLFVTPDSLDVEPLRAMWDHVLIEGRELEVIGTMQLLEPELDSIHFLTMRTGRAGVLLGFRGAGRRAPMGSYGDGMRRLLALSLMRTAEGFLLIDEIDTGLHWTVMEEMWRLVVETARQSSIQVFATTHSFDCLRGLASLVESRPDLAAEISVQKIERLLKKAVDIDAQDLRVAVEQNIEVR